MYKVLLTDDEPIILDGLKLLVNWDELGLEIAGEASNGAAALEFLRNNKVHILITDVKMPVMNGIDLIKAAKSEFPDLKILILSGYDDFEYVKEAARLGIENYLLKPVNDEELVSTLLQVAGKLESDFRQSRQKQKDIDILRDNILLRWVTGTISNEELENRMGLLGLKADDSFYLACLIRDITVAGGATPPDNLLDEPGLKRFAMMNICSDVVGECGAYIFANLDNDIVLLFHSDGKKLDYAAALRLLGNCVKHIRQCLGLNLFASAGSVQPQYEKVHCSYSDALKLMEYNLILPENQIVEHRKVQQELSRLDEEFSIDLDCLRNLILIKDSKGTADCIDEIYSRLRAYKGLSPTLLKNVTTQILFTVLNTISSVSKSAVTLFNKESNVFLKALEMKTLQEQAGWVRTIAGEAVNYLLSADRNYSPVVKKLIQYINGNFHREIALKTVAASLNMSAVYLGQLFKTETGEMFSVYLNRIRIEEAKRQLLSTRLNTADIAAKVGYSSNNHFFAAFKKIVGMSPTEFRRLNNISRL